MADEPTNARKSFGDIAPRLAKDEIIAAIAHLAFCAGWPPAMTALPIVKKVFEEAGV